VSADENLHMIFYRGVGAAAMDIAPDAAMQSVWRILKNFQMPGFTIPNFRRNAVKIAVGGIYDLRQHLDEVVLPVLRYWRIFERDDFTGVGQRNRDDLADFLAQTDVEAAKFEQSKARYLERGAARLERASAKARVS
jgi:acyl-[acyl-carrier-protein] desaturase